MTEFRNRGGGMTTVREGGRVLSGEGNDMCTIFTLFINFITG